MSLRTRTTVLAALVALLALLLVPQARLHADDDEEPSPSSASASLRVMSFNIRYDNRGDGEDAWPNRRAKVASVLRLHRPDLVGLQEALAHQLTQLKGDLSGYLSIGVGRDDGKERGEFSAILYRADRFSVSESGTFWLSEEPRTPGLKGWDAVCPRIVTWAELVDLRTKKEFLIANTHWDHVGTTARARSAEFLQGFMARRGADLPRVLTGDFNCTLDSPPMQAMVEGEILVDAQTLSPHPYHGPGGTFIGFEEPKVATRKIDHILVGGGVRVLQQAVLADHWDGSYPSDHLPVVADLVLP